ncbi:NHL repeat-containing protein [Marinithermus hydrothermalis]|uniref:Vgb family protein n=1 Tax=Marinithermus hydrothermalis TaxID=186192 RepID=UPI0002E97751|nr:NHL repeat-containing protein [Marinithermus hydrothermalis]
MEPSLVRLPPNGSQYITLSATPQGDAFAEAVTVALEANPYLTAEAVVMDPAVPEGTMVVHAVPSAPEGTYQLTLRGETLGYRTSAAPLTLEIFVPGPISPTASVPSGLWVSNQKGGSIQVFTQADLDAAFARLDFGPASVELGVTSVVLEPNLVFETGALSSPTGIVFDAEGNLWVVHHFEGQVTMYAADALAASGPLEPSATLSFGMVGPESVAVDAEGNLWVTDFLADQVLMYARGVLTNPRAAPSVVLSGPLLDQPVGIAFDPDGNLWVTTWGTDTVLRFAAADLTASGSPEPDRVITDPRMQNPTGLLFEGDGDLWISSFTPVNNASWLVKFNAESLRTPGILVPDVVLEVNAAELNGGAGMAFDAQGDLWVASFNVDKLVRLSAEHLTVTGKPPIAVIQLEAGARPAGVRFVPPP